MHILCDFPLSLQMPIASLWALVSEPGFLDFQIFRFLIFDIYIYIYIYICSLQNVFENSGGEISRKHNKGVLDRPWTKWGGFEGHFYYIEIPIYRQMLKSGLSDVW